MRTYSNPYFGHGYNGPRYERARGFLSGGANTVLADTGEVDSKSRYSRADGRFGTLNTSQWGMHGIHAVNTTMGHWHGGPVYVLNPYKMPIGIGNEVVASQRHHHAQSSSIPTESPVDKNSRSQNAQGLYGGTKSTRFFSDDARLYYNSDPSQCADCPKSSTASSSNNWHSNNSPWMQSCPKKQVNPQNTPQASSKKQESRQNTPQKSSQELRILWVGGISHKILEEGLIQKLFSECGEIKSYKPIPTKSCAFVE